MQFNNLNIDMLARKTTIAMCRLNELTSGKSEPSSDEISKIASSFNVSPSDLLNVKFTSFKYYSDEYGNDNLSDYDHVEEMFGYSIRRIVELCTQLNTEGINKVTEYINDLNDVYFIKKAKDQDNSRPVRK